MRRRAPQTQVFFLNLVDFVAKLDDVFDEHLKNATVFKGTSKTVQNELLECMLAVARERIVSTQTQLVLVLRYIDDNHAVQESFFEFISISDSTSVSIARMHWPCSPWRGN